MVGALFAGIPLISRSFSAGLNAITSTPWILPCPLLALRAPRDEASLVIGLGQFVQAMARLLSGVLRIIIAPIAAVVGAGIGKDRRTNSFIAKFVEAARAIGTVMLLALAASLPAVAFGWITLSRPADSTLPGWLLALIWTVLLLWSGLIALFIAGLALLLAWAVPALAIGAAAGPEASLLPIVTQIEAEPLPYAVGALGKRPAEVSLEIIYNTRYGALSHSMYESRAVRKRVARHLKEVLARAPGNP
jgi:hypothetical protein